jgi:hypothetical protein
MVASNATVGSDEQDKIATGIGTSLATRRGWSSYVLRSGLTNKQDLGKKWLPEKNSKCRRSKLNQNKRAEKNSPVQLSGTLQRQNSGS